MSDIVNNLDNIVPKMREQMHNRNVYSLDVLYRAVEQEGETFNVKDLDFFFGKFGIYLKSQEVTTILNYCSQDQHNINLVKFCYLFRTKVPMDIILMLNKIFDVLSGGQTQMDVEELLQNLVVEEHPQKKLLKENWEALKNTVVEGMKIIVGGNKVILREQFLEFHYNILWTLPEYSIDIFRKQVPLMWGLKKLKY